MFVNSYLSFAIFSFIANSTHVFSPIPADAAAVFASRCISGLMLLMFLSLFNVYLLFKISRISRRTFEHIVTDRIICACVLVGYD
jgi:hypothetical protein